MADFDRTRCSVVGCKEKRREGEDNLTCYFHHLMVIEAHEREEKFKKGRKQPTVYVEMWMGGFAGIMPFSYYAVDPKDKPEPDEVYEHYGHLVARLNPEEMEKIDGVARDSDEWKAMAKEHGFDPETSFIREDGVVMVK
jgi:hypothetical protein